MYACKRHLAVLLSCFVFLLILSWLRLQGLEEPAGEVRYYGFVYCGYLLLLTVWGVSIHRRLSQPNLRRYLYAEIAAMALWLTVRFTQICLIRSQYFLRLSGYFICIPLVLLPLFGFYGVFGLDKGPDYRINPRWHLLLIPAAGLILLMLTNEWHHFMFLAEPEVNLLFHPNTGIYLITAWAVAFELARIGILLVKSRHNQDYPYLRFLPFVAAFLMGLLFVPYFASAFEPLPELIELTAKHYFLEAMVWETCIFIGIVPVNSQYGQVFEHSTVAMQITDAAGRPLIASRYAPAISASQFSLLQKEHQLPLGEGLELCLHKIPDGFLIWQRDLTAVNSLLQELHQTSDELQQEGFLLRRELEAKSEESRIEAKNRIYDRLSTETAPQLALLDRLLTADPADSQSWSRIGFIGTYVKRLCNLRLIYQETGTVENADLKRSLENMLSWLAQLDICTDLAFTPPSALPPAVSFMSIKLLECLPEQLAFRLDTCCMTVSGSLLFEIRMEGTALLPVEQVQQLLADGYAARWNTIPGGFRLTIEKEAQNREKVQ